MNANTQSYRHVVLFKFKPNTSPDTIHAIENAFKAFATSLPFVIGYEWGLNTSIEKLNKGFTHCFIVTFKDEAGRDAYLPHPNHKRFIKEHLDPNLDDVCVVDFYAQW